ncbi:MAG: hydrogenase expression/formation C-terminal domain-containing protein [Wenzhouxiangellaceae bacterium]|nr:hydrogenase expression/formation C-terminal domain-containing protein [Wenzhouxiangellaceae bacterium]
MSQAIPLKIRSMRPGHTIGAGVHALAHEIVAGLERLQDNGESSAIDLKSLPMAPEEFNEVRDMLGSGEIDLTLDLDGPTRIRETAYPGVWWIRHESGDGRVLAEYIEIGRFPEFLAAQPEHVSDSVRQLKDRLKGAA